MKPDKNKKKKFSKTEEVIPKRRKSVSSNSIVLSPEVIPSVIEGGSALQNYMARISKIPVLSKDEEYKLTVAYYETRDSEIAKKLIQSNLRFVVKVAAEYSKFSSKIMDLIQEGNIGLMRALKEFNPYKGAKLITYAVWWIRGYIQEYLMRHHSIVRLGTNKKQQRLFYLLQKEKQKLEDYSEKKLLPSLAKATQTKEKDVEQMKEVVLKKDFSLDQPISSEKGEKSFLEFQQDESSIDDMLSLYQISKLLKKHLKKIESKLNYKEKVIIKDRFLKEPAKTLQEIADEFNVTREAIRQSEERLMKKLKAELIPILKKPY
ncbi:MAG: sigma-70 family RNA polymerase sigma factor [Bdellovibrionaceae bacterium]|nr:sigma-70 family RNA polymerase sigma factor [Pseudobdellovibrionaceae bacterium]